MKHQQIPTTNVAKSWVVSYKTGSQTYQGRTVRKKVPITWAAKFTKGKLETRGSLGKISIVIKEMQIKTVVARDERILDAELELIGVIYSEDNLAIHTKGSKFTSAISRNHPWKIIRDAQTEVPIWVHCICAYNQWKLAVTSVFCNRASLEEMIACATAGFFFLTETGWRWQDTDLPLPSFQNILNWQIKVLKEKKVLIVLEGHQQAEYLQNFWDLGRKGQIVKWL